ncbi:TPA: 2-hydroxycarboxylate transporter family protein, partial [Enterococcus faecium]
MLKTLNRIKIDFIPLSLYIILVLAYLAMTISNIVPENDMLVSLGIMTVFAYLLEEIGKTIPILKDLGGKVLVVTFLPAFLV